MNTILIPLLMLSGTLVLCSTVHAQTEPTSPRFYERGAEGWFWYAEQPPEPEEELEPPPDPPPTPAPEEVAEQPPAPETPSNQPGPTPLSAAWLRANLERYRDVAIDDPSPQNVSLYLYLQRLAIDKAERFAEASQRAVWSDPFLDETTRRPLATFAANLVNREAANQRDQALTKTAQVAGLWFLYRSDCPYCEAQAPLLELLTNRYGLDVQAIALDGRPLPSGFFPNFRTDSGQARALGVVSTPALFLVRPPDGIKPLSQGVLSLAELQQRIVQTAADAGWIDPRWLERSRARVTALRLDTSTFSDPDLAEDPERLLEHLRGQRRAIPNPPVTEPLIPSPTHHRLGGH
ncbi:conjugal transfer protein TraF [Thiorhodovibrio frisius]|uniref:conjugal transfer protein TraF n=1 Tax=Thiorhodovibrio frisius TaxID=631362 RepID=UPI002B256723|nr:conjugal transfer protein TraF [Thiorhodovibrio frisius]WPL23167.1 conjugal pilus assembly protein TraF [Thiorhodovibrio frisius]